MRKSFLIRISPDLWEELNRWAAEDLRSVNGQIEYLLRQAVVARRRRGLKVDDSSENEEQSENSTPQ